MCGRLTRGRTTDNILAWLRRNRGAAKTVPRIQQLARRRRLGVVLPVLLNFSIIHFPRGGVIMKLPRMAMRVPTRQDNSRGRADPGRYQRVQTAGTGVTPR